MVQLRRAIRSNKAPADAAPELSPQALQSIITAVAAAQSVHSAGTSSGSSARAEEAGDVLALARPTREFVQVRRSVVQGFKDSLGRASHALRQAETVAMGAARAFHDEAAALDACKEEVDRLLRE